MVGVPFCASYPIFHQIPSLGHHVVFGRILKGYKEVIERLANIPVDEKDRPTVPIVIANCGELELRKVPTAGI